MSGPDKDSGRRLPIKQVSKTKVGAKGIIGRTDLGSKEDFVGLRVEDFECHSMTTMGRDTNKISKSFRGFTGEGGIINSIEHWLIPVKPEKGAYIHSSTKKDRQGNLPVQGLTRSAVQDNTNVLEAQKPAGFWAARAVHGKVGQAFGCLVTSFHGVLVLSVGLTGPLPNTESTKDIQDTFTAKVLGMVTEKSCRGTTLANDVFQGIHKLFVSLHPKHIHDMRCTTTEDSSRSSSIINGGSIRIDNIREKVLIATCHIERWEWGLVVQVHAITHRNTGILGSALKGTCNNFRGKEGEELAELGRVDGGFGNVWGHVGKNRDIIRRKCRGRFSGGPWFLWFVVVHGAKRHG